MNNKLFICGLFFTVIGLGFFSYSVIKSYGIGDLYDDTFGRALSLGECLGNAGFSALEGIASTIKGKTIDVQKLKVSGKLGSSVSSFTLSVEGTIGGKNFDKSLAIGTEPLSNYAKDILKKASEVLV